MNIHHSAPRALLLAGVSALTLAAASPQARAADASIPLKAPAPAPAPAEWRLWVEGGAFLSSGDPNGVVFPSFGPESTFAFKPNIAAQGAAGADYHVAGSAWHLSAQFRYGRATDSASQGFGYTFNFGPQTATVSEAATGTEQETHWLADFAVGRDFNIGADTLQAKAGVRVAELTATANVNNNILITVPLGPITSALYTFDIQQKSKFLGIGPRVGFERDTPLGGGWEINWLGDVAVLFGRRTLDQSTTLTAIGFPGPVGPFVATLATSSSGTIAVPNADAQVGVSYWVNRNVKLSVSYRVDAFYHAIKTIDANGAEANVSRVVHGPQVGATIRF